MSPQFSIGVKGRISVTRGRTERSKPRTCLLIHIKGFKEQCHIPNKILASLRVDCKRKDEEYREGKKLEGI